MFSKIPVVRINTHWVKVYPAIVKQCILLETLYDFKWRGSPKKDRLQWAWLPRVSLQCKMYTTQLRTASHINRHPPCQGHCLPVPQKIDSPASETTPIYLLGEIQRQPACPYNTVACLRLERAQHSQATPFRGHSLQRCVAL